MKEGISEPRGGIPAVAVTGGTGWWPREDGAIPDGTPGG